MEEYKSTKSQKMDENNPNRDICEVLLEIAEYERNVNRNTFKSAAYKRAALVLAQQPSRVTSGKEAQKLHGIGKGIAGKIDEYLKTGKVRKLEDIRADENGAAISELTEVSGIGPVKARQLAKEGITTIEQLREHPELLNRHQRIGLKYFEDLKKRIPRAEITRIEKLIRQRVQKLDEKYDITICGSYRRGKATSRDIDTLLSHEAYKSRNSKNPGSLLYDVVEALRGMQLITEKISQGKVKFMGVCKVDKVVRKLDIRLTPSDQYYCAVLYFTGSALFNQEMRIHALSKGFTLNEYSLRKIGKNGKPGKPLPVSSEKDIFDYIQYPYKSPTERDV